MYTSIYSVGRRTTPPATRIASNRSRSDPAPFTGTGALNAELRIVVLTPLIEVVESGVRLTGVGAGGLRATSSSREEDLVYNFDCFSVARFSFAGTRLTLATIARGGRGTAGVGSTGRLRFFPEDGA